MTECNPHFSDWRLRFQGLKKQNCVPDKKRGRGRGEETGWLQERNKRMYSILSLFLILSPYSPLTVLLQSFWETTRTHLETRRKQTSEYISSFDWNSFPFRWRQNSFLVLCLTGFTFNKLVGRRLKFSPYHSLIVLILYLSSFITAHLPAVTLFFLIGFKICHFGYKVKIIHDLHKINRTDSGLSFCFGHFHHLLRLWKVSNLISKHSLIRVAPHRTYLLVIIFPVIVGYEASCTSEQKNHTLIECNIVILEDLNSVIRTLQDRAAKH